MTGTNWTGKSTTISLLEKGCCGPFKVISLSKLIDNCPHPVILNQTFNTSVWMMNSLASIIKANEHSGVYIYDRTPLDILAFTLYVRDKDKIHIPENFLLKVQQAISMFDVIFYLPISSDWPVSITNHKIPIEFAKLIDMYTLEAISLFDIDVCELPWDLQERVDILTKFIKTP